MIQGSYIAEAIEFNSCEKGKINLIKATCGAGKSTAALQLIPEKLNISPNHCLILIDTNSGQDSFIKEGAAKYYTLDYDRWDFTFTKEENKPIVMTYAAFGSLIKKQEIKADYFEYIVCDEIHTMSYPVSMARGKLRKQFPLALPWEINDMLKITCFNYIAIETIRDWAEKENKWIFGLTATPDDLDRITQFDNLINEVKFSQQLRAYEIISSFDYTEIEKILQARIPDERKRLFFFNTVKELEKYKNILIESGRKAEAIWSCHATQPMNSHQHLTRDYLLETHTLPDDVQDLLINKSYETAITIKDDKLKEIYIHTSNPTTREQVRGRARQDIEVVGYYNKDLAHEREKQVEKKRKQAENFLKIKVIIPEKYLNKYLTKQDKDKLIEEIEYPKGWTTLKKALVKQGYEVKDGASKGVRYSIISILK